MADGFDVKELDEFTKDLMAMANDLDKGKHAKKFLRVQGSKLNKENKKQAKSVNIGKKTGNYLKGFKRGKPYNYNGAFAIRAYNSSPHAHLLEDGHRMVTEDGREVGFVEGFHVLDKAKKSIEEGYYNDVEEFIDELLKDHNL